MSNFKVPKYKPPPSYWDELSAAQLATIDGPRFIYSPLDPKVDGIRLVVLEPSLDHFSTVKCSLRHVTFGERPKYEALSYTWGDQETQGEISIQGQVFRVGRNLLEALKFLRDPEKERVIWIDAICINQEDIQEKNRQITIMPYIYTRAQVVLVWLGVPTASLLANICGSDRPSLKQMKESIQDCWSNLFGKVFADHKGMLKAMHRVAYWNRLWIIQEISLARKVQICYASKSVEWKAFVHAISATVYVEEENVPMKLHKQISEKYKTGHQLQNLLESHQQALCKEPRDHVYGFVGLATDCADGFPLDYQKSLFEVWKDTVMYRNRDRHASRHDIMKFGSLVRKLLGGSSIATVDEISQDLTMRMALRPPRRDSLHFSGRVVGRINYRGPTYVEIIADLKKTAQWKSSVNRYIRKENLPDAMEDSDAFLEELESVEDEDLEGIVAFNRDDLWKAPEITDVFPDTKIIVEGREAWKETKIPPSDGTAPDSPKEQRLILLDFPSSRLNFPARMGLAPPEARVGDYILQIHGIQRAIIVRKTKTSLDIVGAAVLAEAQWRDRTRRMKKEVKETKFGKADFEFSDTDAIDVVLDAGIAYYLLLHKVVEEPR